MDYYVSFVFDYCADMLQRTLFRVGPHVVVMRFTYLAMQWLHVVGGVANWGTCSCCCISLRDSGGCCYVFRTP